MIKFFNIKTGETRTLDPATMDPQFIEPAISALYNSSNLHVNAMLGQDFGWRIAPETVRRIQEVKQDDMLVSRIAAQTQILPENLQDTDILTWIVKDDARREAMKNQETEQNYEEQYQRELREATQRPAATEPGIPAESPANQIPSQPQAPAPVKEADNLDDLEAQTAAAAKANEPTEADRKKAQEEEERLMRELEEEEAREKEEAAKLEAESGVSNAADHQKAAEENAPAKNTVAKPKAKSDNKSNS